MNLSRAEIAKQLDISITQIYRWEKNGISIRNKHYQQLKEILPNLSPKEVSIKYNGEEDNRYKAGRNKKEITLRDSDIKTSKEIKFKSSLFPDIKIKQKNSDA